MKNAYILHSLGLPKHQSKIYGEIDFVIVCDRSVACLEVKGGRIECRDVQCEEASAAADIRTVQVMEALGMNDHLLVSGGTGTGKTLLAADFAIKRAGQGRKVLFLTYNKNLANEVKRQTGERAGIKIINIHALFGEYMTVDADSVQKNAGHYFAEELPDAFYSYLQEQDQRQMAKLQYDLLIMEEKQTIVACGAGSVSKRVYPDGRIERCENVKDVASFIERIDEMIERKRKLLGD